MKVQTWECFFLLQTYSYLSINNKTFTPCKFILCETNLQGTCSYTLAKICIGNDLIESFCIS